MKNQTTFTHQIPNVHALMDFRRRGPTEWAIGSLVGVNHFTFSVSETGGMTVFNKQYGTVHVLCQVTVELIAELNKFNLTHTQPVNQIKTTAQELDDASYDLFRKLQDRMNSGTFKFNSHSGIADFDGCTLQFIETNEDPEIPLITVSVGDVFRMDLFKSEMRKILFHVYQLAVEKAKQQKKAEDTAKLEFIKSIKI